MPARYSEVRHIQELLGHASAWYDSQAMLHPKEIVEAALALGPEEREEVINDLWASLDGGLGEEWEAEIQRRVADVDAGRVKTIPAEEVFSRLDRHFGGR